MKWIGRILGYYVFNFIVALGLLLLYGQYDSFAGYYILVLPISVFITTIIMIIIRFRFENINKILFFLLYPILNIISLVGLFILLIFTD